MIRNYVLVLAQTGSCKGIIELDNPILLIHKNRPAWQKGRYNLPGGKVEPGEDPADTAVRELLEETGLVSLINPPQLMGQITGDWGAISGDTGAIYCYKIWVKYKAVEIQKEETERPFWTNWETVKNDERLMPNLRVAIPLMVLGTTDWIIYDNGPSWNEDRHRFSIEVQSTTKQFNEGEE